MKSRIGIIIGCIGLFACGTENQNKSEIQDQKDIKGTWRLVKATLIEKGDTTVTRYAKNISFIKIINETHFAFLQHDLNKGKDSAVFVAGGGQYTLTDSTYTENLEYCSAREWESLDFKFNISLKGDTLIQRGIEEVASAGVNRLNIEKYVKVKK